jgi:endonuclease/exonuclease/phosphatase (EEP) superfamily protein YafD
VKLISIALGSLVIATTILPFLRTGFWFVRIFDFPRLQIACVGVVALLGYIVAGVGTAWGDIAFAGLLFASVLYQAKRIFPYTRLARPQVQRSKAAAHESSFSLLFSNVLIENRDAQKLKKVVRDIDPDIILTVETDDWWSKQLSELESTHPYTVQRPQDNGYGMLLYSRLELLNVEVKFLIEDEIPSIHGQVRLDSGDFVSFRCLHPRPPFPTEDKSSTGRDAELLVVGEEIKGMKDPVVVFGDLNDVSWSHTNNLFQRVSGMLDPRVGRGLFNTFHAEYPFMRFPLDHFFHSKQFRLIDLRRLDYVGSDHFPVYIKLSLESDADRHPDEMPATDSDKKEAEDKIRKGLTETSKSQK